MGAQTDGSFFFYLIVNLKKKKKDDTYLREHNVMIRNNYECVNNADKEFSKHDLKYGTVASQTHRLSCTVSVCPRTLNYDSAVRNVVRAANMRLGCIVAL